MIDESPLVLHSAEEGDILLPGRCPPAGFPPSALVSLDYDGTLRRKGAAMADIAPQIFELLGQLRRCGVRWGINSGRNLADMAKVLALLPMQPDFICTCERYVYLSNHAGLLRPLVEHNAHCYAVNLKLRDSVHQAWQAALRRLRIELPHAEWTLSATDPLSIEARDSETMDLIMPYILSFVNPLPGITVQRAGKYLRLADARFNKGIALQRVLAAWHVPMHCLFLMGDGHNDLDAFRLFPQAFCAVPADAHADVLRWVAHNYGSVFADVPSALCAWQKRFFPHALKG